ncbi:GIY-YIG nuclease family protein [Thermoanaerobacterium thermosaccharolyticum]|uniref:GIY-YIG nuclease family protein n=1 Tax=Thermoanaerobacterium thermosaccharolyticum TaxID=1517 RepID=UPI0026D793F5
MYYVYIIKNENGGIYTGYSENIRKRLEAHNKELNKYTKGHKWELIYYEAYKAKEDAQKREKQLKKSHNARRWLKERIAKSINS